ncbi:MAG: DUF3791 domain-containing protein [Synergistaceae bacterium]|jgi:hypothetical protein|nr:DUF3791 domain-containing protein [Synergistaceae bacterium]
MENKKDISSVIAFITPGILQLLIEKKGLSLEDASNYLHRAGATKFITDCWDGLHMTGPLYIIDSIDEYIASHAEGKITA